MPYPYATLADVLADINSKIVENNIKDISGQEMQDVLKGLHDFIPGPDVNKPLVMSATLITPTQIRIVFDKKVTLTNVLGCSVLSPSANAIISKTGNGTNTLNFLLTTPVAVGATVSWSYQSSLGDLSDANGNELLTGTYSVFNPLQAFPSLDQLSNVLLVTPSTGQVLAYNATSGKWENATFVGGGGVWGSILGTLSNQTDLQNALNAKQVILVSGTNIKTLNGASLLGSGNLFIPGIAPGGNPGEVLTKVSLADYDFTWSVPVRDLPVGGAEGMTLVKASAADYDVAWFTWGDVFSQFLKRTATFTADGTLDLAAGETVLSFMIFPSTSLTGFQVGITPGGSELIGPLNVFATGDWLTFSLQYKSQTAKTLYIQNVTGVLEVELVTL